MISIRPFLKNGFGSDFFLEKRIRIRHSGSTGPTCSKHGSRSEQSTRIRIRNTDISYVLTPPWLAIPTLPTRAYSRYNLGLIYQMVTQNTLRTCKGNRVFSLKWILILGLMSIQTQALNSSNYRFNSCAPISDLPWVSQNLPQICTASA